MRRIFRLGLYLAALVSLVATTAHAIEPEFWTENVGALFFSGRSDEAATAAEEALGEAQRRHGPEHVSVAAALNDMAAIALRRGLHEVAERHYRQAITILEQAEPNRGRHATVLGRLAQVYAEQDHLVRSEALTRRALNLWQNLKSSHGDNPVLETYGRLADILRRLGRDEEAHTAHIKSRRKRGIFGRDDRQDWHKVADPAIRRIMQATVALIPRVRTSGTAPAPTGQTTTSELKLAAAPVRDKKFQCEATGKSLPLCAREAFAGQHSLAVCSGTLISADRVLTAGHCLLEVRGKKAPELKDLLFVFGYRSESDNDPGRTTFPASHVYRGVSVEGRFEGSRLGADWAIVRLDRPVRPDIALPVSTRAREKIADTAQVYMVGFPVGLPMKVAGPARLRRNNEPYAFLATLDAFHVNSGSAVYRWGTNELVGILVSGGADWACNPSAECVKAKICREDFDDCPAEDKDCQACRSNVHEQQCRDCRGEVVLRTSAIPALHRSEATGPQPTQPSNADGAAPAPAR